LTDHTDNPKPGQKASTAQVANPYPIVEVSSGRLRGALINGVCTFKGVPYAESTAGAHRFLAPRPITWAGVRDALVLGPRSPQNEPHSDAPYHSWLRDNSAEREDCLVLNVFTTSLAPTARRPVMVYLHGGGFVISSGDTPGVDGSNLARQDAVVVTVNHRLNLFGYLYLGNADGGKYAESTNAGLLDLIASLKWVRDNIARFGGDPDNVTLFGQSGGGSKVALMMSMPQAQGLFHKAIIQSASSLLRMATLEEAERNTHHFLKQLGLDTSGLRALHELPVQTLLQAMPAAIKAAGGIDNFRPVVDGQTLPSQPFEEAALRLSRNVPMMTGWCENEQRLAFAARPAVYQQSPEDALSRTAHALDVPLADAARLTEVYRQGRPLDSAGDIYTQILGDHRYRRSVTRAAEKKASYGGAPAYLYLLNWKTPVQGGMLRAPHTMCLAFTFANVAVASGMVGNAPEPLVLQEQMAGAWLAFARTGNPNHGALPAWLPYNMNERPTMVFDRETRLVNDPLREERIAFEDFPRYVAAHGESRSF